MGSAGDRSITFRDPAARSIREISSRDACPNHKSRAEIIWWAWGSRVKNRGETWDGMSTELRRRVAGKGEGPEETATEPVERQATRR